MLGRWVRHLLWKPFEASCRRTPLVPFHASVTQFNGLVAQVRIDNVVTRAISRLGGGYDYSVSYIVDKSLLVDTGFPWARRSLRRTLIELGADKTVKTVINTHSHEDHVGNNDMLAELCGATIFAHPLAVTDIRHPPEIPWYRRFMFGPQVVAPAIPAPAQIHTSNCTFEVVGMPGHSRDHICLFEPTRRWLFSGDLYVAADLDSQLCDVDGPIWIKSLEAAVELQPKCLFDGHGLVVNGEDEVRTLLTGKLDFLRGLQRAIEAAAQRTGSVAEITQRVFGKRGAMDRLTFSDGWLSLLTCSDFCRSHLVRSFLRALPDGELLGAEEVAQ